jgi:hypothetical protein
MSVFVADVVKKAMEQGRIAHPGFIGSVHFAAAQVHHLNLDTDGYLDRVYAVVPQLPTLLGEWVKECSYQRCPIDHKTIDKLVKVEMKDVIRLSAEYETILLHSGIEPEEFFKRDVILDRLVEDSQDILKKAWK